jgi:hypothetical protein
VLPAPSVADRNGELAAVNTPRASVAPEEKMTQMIEILHENLQFIGRKFLSLPA